LRTAVRGVEVIYHIAAIYRQAGLRDEEYRAVNAEASARSSKRPRRRRPPRGPLQHRRGPRRRRASAGERGCAAETGDVYQQTKLEGERVARAARRTPASKS
jgi:hypothetical protein